MERVEKVVALGVDWCKVGVAMNEANDSNSRNRPALMRATRPTIGLGDVGKLMPEGLDAASERSDGVRVVEASFALGELVDVMQAQVNDLEHAMEAVLAPGGGVLKDEKCPVQRGACGVAGGLVEIRSRLGRVADSIRDLQDRLRL